jgi:hypothetical protein
VQAGRSHGRDGHEEDWCLVHAADATRDNEHPDA